MIAEELVSHLIAKVPTFANPQILGPGIAFHYTQHYDKIISTGKLLGAPIDENLDRTQMTLESKPATDDPGVVFCYENMEDAIEEGFGSQIIKVEYKEAVRSLHSQEGDLELAPAPDTILVLTTDILSFELIGSGDSMEDFGKIEV